MKRIQEKVKDLVEARSYRSLQNFASEPAQTLAAYHFTDATSELMTKYLDRIAGLQPRSGAAFALAGYRGVGKSHFLATLGAIAAHTELRAKITDARAAASAERLRRTRYPAAYVRRGTRPTLIEEVKDAIAKTFEINAASLPNSLPELLNFAAGKAGDLPLLLFVDTAFERVSRVARDDGALLAQIADAAKNLNLFVVAALDDDITGADGVNAAIAKSFTIDYLDTEHLYRIVDAHIFPKNRRYLPVLHDIYANFREVLPSFRWSEQRFSALYPLHPAILEIAPFVRLYAPEFALLGFASEAGRKIMARPANSLIAPDEVFDAVEATLRKVADLSEAFAAYDRIGSEFIAQISVMQRLQAKLVLKALFLLSLEGADGASAGEIGAAMLVYDESDPLRGAKTLEDLLENIAAAFPADVLRTSDSSGEIRYSLKISSAADLNRALAEAVKTIEPQAVVGKIMRRAARDKFSDWTEAAAESENAAIDSTDCNIVWRGSLRRGRLRWNLENKPDDAPARENAGALDWEIIITPKPETPAGGGANIEGISTVYWQPAPLRADEIETISRFYVLQTDSALSEKFGEQVGVAAHSHALAIEKIWVRVFLEDAKLVIDGFDYQFSEQARAAESLTETLSNMLEPLFEAKFPEHPYFLQTLGGSEVARLVSDFFGGARQNLSDAQQLAETFALPLGLVDLHENSYVVEREETLVKQILPAQVLNLVRENPEQTVSLATIYKRLKQSPYGLTSEAQHLILTALVAQRQIEFVTTKGNRINRRSLDLQIIWSDIEGIAKPSSVVYSTGRLTEWARILTGSDLIRSIDAPDEKALVRDALENWLADWKQAKLLERFADLPDEVLNTKIWRLAGRAEKTFGAVAAIISAVAGESIGLEEGLHRVAEAFSDSEREFAARADDLIVLEDFTGGVAVREEVWNYLALCENTRDEKIEILRERLAALVEESRANPSDALNREMANSWGSFRHEFAQYFALEHDMLMKSPDLAERLDEILNGDAWWEFEALSRLPVFQKNFWKRAQAIARRRRDLDCRFEVREMLKTRPFCSCSFSLSQTEAWENLPDELDLAVNHGRKSYARILRSLADTLIPLIGRVALDADDDEFIDAAENLSRYLKNVNPEPDEFLTNNQLVILEKVFENPALSIEANSPAEDERQTKISSCDLR